MNEWREGRNRFGKTIVEPKREHDSKRLPAILSLRKIATTCTERMSNCITYKTLLRLGCMDQIKIKLCNTTLFPPYNNQIYIFEDFIKNI